MSALSVILALVLTGCVYVLVDAARFAHRGGVARVRAAWEAAERRRERASS